MAKAGYDSYLFCRPGQGNCPLPADDFIWVGFDGSRIAAHRADTYGTLMGEAGKQWRNGWIGSAAGRKGSSRQWAVSSGAWEPRRRAVRADLEALRELKERTEDWNLVHSTPEAYFAARSEAAKRRG